MVATGCITALAAVLALAGASKLRGPEPLSRALGALGVPPRIELARALGVAELALAALALLAPVRVSGLLLAALFACFALATRRLGAAAAAGCGCFGAQEGRPPGRAQIALNALGAICAAAAATQAPPSPIQLAREDPAAVLAVLAAGCLVAALWRRALAGGARPVPGGAESDGALTSVPGGGPLGEGLVGASAAFLERRFSRRSALARTALVGSALCVAPLRYLLRPESALAVILPGDCASGDCTDGYTAFCCEINNGVNQCPADTYPGGWWMCTDYAGRQLCASQGVRYYVDCNALPGHPFPGGCRCANGTCDERRVNCNIFRYGQCNPQVVGVTAVVCRMVVCQSPASILALNCSASLAVDDSVCAHEAPCLEPPAVQLAGAGGV